MPKSQVVSFVRKNAAKVAVVGSTVLAATAAHAADDKWGLATYVTEAKDNVSLVVAGVIAVAALAFGVGLLTSFLRR